MTLLQILLMLRARWRLALSLMVGFVALAVPVIFLMPKQYTASTSLAVDVKSPDPITMLLMPSNMATQEDLVRSERVTQRVIKTLGLDADPALREEWRNDARGKGSFQVWLAEALHRKLSIATRRDSASLTIEYRARDPRMAAAVANAFADIYVETVVDLKVQPAKQYARVFGEQGKALRENLEAAQARMSEFQQRKGIGIKDETLDAETAKLAELSSQLTAVQAQTVDAHSKQRSASGALPEVMGNAVIQGLRADIARQEAKLKDASGNLGRNHPQYQSMASELAELKASLANETRHVSSSFSATRSVGSDKEKETKAAIEAQRKKLLALRSERDELAVLQRDVEAAKNAYEAVEKRYTQTNLESQAAQTNVFVLRPATEPTEPSSPKKVPYTLAAILLGAMLGLGVAYVLELMDRRVRCVDDVAGLLQMPVLGVIERKASRGALSVRRRNAPLPQPGASSA
jgi:succinoglycan biosynthesis transport protein ExoP